MALTKHDTAEVTIKRRDAEDVTVKVGFDYLEFATVQDAIESFYAKREAKDENGNKLDAMAQIVNDLNIISKNRSRANATQTERQKYALAEDPEKAFEKALRSLIAAGVDPKIAEASVASMRAAK